MRRSTTHHREWLGLVAACCCAIGAAPAQVIPKEDPPQARGVDLVPMLGGRVPLATPITDWTGKTVELGKYFKSGKPVVLALVYYNCPLICPLVLQRLQERVNGVPYALGDDFTVVVVSFDPSNTTEMAAANREGYFTGYNKAKTPAAQAAWAFHTATVGSARAIADAVGFKYKYLDESGQYAHPAVLTVLTPDGRVSGYVSGLDVGADELRVALLQASEGKIAKTWGDFFLHRCYRYDPNTGAYTFQAMRVMQAAGLLSVVAVTTLIVGLRAAERARKLRLERTSSVAGPGGRPAPGVVMMGRTA
jgi:protein SCO1/2